MRNANTKFSTSGSVGWQVHFLYHPEDEEEEEYDTKSLDEVVANYIDPEMVASYNCEMASHIVDFYAAAIVASYNWGHNTCGNHNAISRWDLEYWICNNLQGDSPVHCLS